MLQATLSTLQKELNDYQERVKFLTKYVNFIFTNEYATELDEFEAKDKAYELQKELDFKKSLITQREAQIKQAEEQVKLKEKAVEEFPDLIIKANAALNDMIRDLDKFENIKKRSKDQNDFMIGLKGQIDQCNTIIGGANKRFEDNPENNQLLNDFRQLHEIIKLVN